MAPQLQINQGPQDALLFDNTRSYFTNVGYVRTSNFQMELRDIDPQNAANLGQTVNFVIPKAADLLGPVDLMVEFAKVTTAPGSAGDGKYWGWVESVGLAMIEKITFSVGSHDVETLTGEHLNIMNELMRSDTHRYGFNQTLKTGRPLIRSEMGGGALGSVTADAANTGNSQAVSWDASALTEPLRAGDQFYADAAFNTLIGTIATVHTATGDATLTTNATAYADNATLYARRGPGSFYTDTSIEPDSYDRLIAYDNVIKKGKKLIIPLGLFFTTHPSKYFPLASIAGCNDMRIAIKFRTANELIMCHGQYPHTTSAINNAADNVDAQVASKLKFDGGSAFASKGCVLRCHYLHVTGPEATALMNREHVRLMKLWHGNEVSKQFSIRCSATGSADTMDLDLSFLHPVQELIITIRKVSEMGSQVDNVVQIGTGQKPAANTAQTKNYFAYHGGGKDPNMESHTNCVEENGISAAPRPTYLKTTTFQLKLNGQSRHLDGQGIDRDYLMNRLMPMLHSNTGEHHAHVATSSVVRGVGQSSSGSQASFASDFDMLSQLKDRKEIYVYPFALNPEGANPSGSVNFSKVSHAKLSIGVIGYAPSGDTSDDYQVDVYGVYYNWLAIKDGRALTSFA